MKHQFSISDLSKSRKQLLITEIDPEVLKKAEKKVLQELAGSLKIKGFRPGKIPESVVREQIEDSYIRLQTLQQAIPDVANTIVQEKQFRILGEPKIDFKSLDPLEVVIEFDLYPTLSLGDYSKISVKKEKKNATDKEVEEAVKHVQQRMIEYKKVDRAAKKDDRVEIDFDGKTSDGVPLENASSKNHPVVIGSNMLIPGFEDELIGLKAGEEKDFSITFPKDYHAKSLAGKEAVFHTKVHQVEESTLPELNDDFVEKLTGKKQPVADWKKLVKDQIQKEHDSLSQQQFEEKYYDQLIVLSAVDLPQSLIDEEKQAILQEIKQQILMRGMSYEHYLQASGKSEEQLLESFDKQAEDRLKLRMALQEIAQKEKISVSDIDIEERLNELLQKHPEQEREKVKQQYQPGSGAYAALEYQIKMQKTLEKILPKV